MKSKIKAKIEAGKAKIAAKASKVKSGKVAKAVSLLAIMLAFAGCATSDPASRLTKAEYNIRVYVDVGSEVKSPTISVPFTFGDGALASADSAGSTESITATPTNDVKPDTNIDVPINKSGGGQSVGSVLGDAVAGLISGVTTKSGSVTADAKTENSTGATTNAANCATCTDGTCTDCTVK